MNNAEKNLTLHESWNFRQAISCATCPHIAYSRYSDCCKHPKLYKSPKKTIVDLEDVCNQHPELPGVGVKGDRWVVAWDRTALPGSPCGWFVIDTSDMSTNLFYATEEFAQAKCDGKNGVEAEEVKKQRGKETYYAQKATDTSHWEIWERNDLHDVRIGYGFNDKDKTKILNALNRVKGGETDDR